MGETGGGSSNSARLRDWFDADGFRRGEGFTAGSAARILELGGNNALIVSPSADLDMATHSIFFGAVGTAGQRCTSTRRVIVHESVADKLREQLLSAYKSVRIGNPLDRATTDGPLVDSASRR